jgi:hypothetical protein
MVVEYLRLMAAMVLTIGALMVSLNRHHALLSAFSRITDRAGELRPIPKRRQRTVQIDDDDAGRGNWQTASGRALKQSDDETDWLVDDDD